MLIANIAYDLHDNFAIVQDAGLCKLKTYQIIKCTVVHAIFFNYAQEIHFLGLSEHIAQNPFLWFGNCFEVFLELTLMDFL